MAGKHSAKQPLKSKWASGLKFYGALLLLLSFVTQNYLYDKWNGEQQIYMTALNEAITIDHSTALNELLYFAITDQGDKNFSDQLRLIKLHKAASAYATSVSITGGGREIDPDLNKNFEDPPDIAGRVSQIHDYHAYIDFRRSFNQKERAAHIASAAQFLDFEIKKRTARFIYLALYLLGGALTLFGMFKEHRSDIKNPA